MKSFSHIIILLLVLILLSCGSKGIGGKTLSEDGSFEVKINISAGDDYFEIIDQDTFSFTPYPYNFGSINSESDLKMSCLVLSNQLSKNSRIKVIPIGLLNFKEFDEEKKLIIAIPRDTKNRVIKADDLMDLVTKYPAIKSMIQDWTLGKCGIGCSKFLSWEDANAAGLWIQRNLS